MLSHDAVTFAAGDAARLCEISESDRQLSAVPNAHPAGLFAHVSLSLLPQMDSSIQKWMGAVPVPRKQIWRQTRVYFN